MKLTVRHIADHLRLAIGAEVKGLSAVEVINLAGAWLAGAHAWAFYENTYVGLTLRGDFSRTAAVWDASALTLTKAGSFANWKLFTGDLITATGGTGITPGNYAISEKISADTVKLATSMGTSTSDVAFTLTHGRKDVLHVPDGLEEIQGIDAAEGNSSGLAGFITKAELARIRAAQPIVTVPGRYYLAPFWFGTPRRERWCEVYPEPTELAVGYFRAYGRGTWLEVTDDESVVDLPDYMNHVFIEACRAFVRGYQQPESDPLGPALADLAQGPLFDAALRVDSTFVPDIGVLGPGAARRPYVPNPLWGPIGDPVSP